MSTFHPFPRLPTELRLKIWEFALRPFTPGVHFFTVYNRREDDYVLDGVSIKDKDPRQDGHLLAAPPFGAGPSVSVSGSGSGTCSGFGPTTISIASRYSWIENNPSAYLWDIGLRDACYESRLIHYRAAHRLTAHFPSSSRASINAITTNNLTHHQKTRCFHLYPFRDLIVLIPYNPSTVFWFGHPPQIIRDLAFINRPSAGLPVFAHIAIEFNPSSWKPLRSDDTLFSLTLEPGLRGYFMRALELMTKVRNAYRPNRLWLIDYNLRRLPATKHAGNPVKFYGTDRVFVEVSRESCCRTGDQMTAFAFLDMVKRGCEANLGEYRHFSMKSSLKCDACFFGACSASLFDLNREVGVLACEKLVG